MRARAEAAAATRERILASARFLLQSHSFDEMTVDAIASGAGTTVRTVLRIFQSKEDLFAEALHSLGELGHAPIVHGDAAAMIAGTYDFYEKIGDTVIRWLADERRIPALHEHLNVGRRHFRSWVAEAFAPALARESGAAREELHNALIAALDVYTWKLLRRDLGLPRAAAEAVMRRTVAALTREDEHGKDSVVELVGRRQPAAKSRHRAGAERTRA
jgi:AcrR family transcriptional regulator